MTEIFLRKLANGTLAGATESDQEALKRLLKKEYDAKRYAENPGPAKSRAVMQRATQVEKVKQYRKTYYQENADAIKKKVHEWNKRNPGKRDLRVKQWKEQNPERVRELGRRHQHKRRAGGGSLSDGLREKLFRLQKGKCACCGLSLGLDYQMDHWIPLALGGKNEDSNIILLRRSCNAKKLAKDPITFMQERGFLL